MYFSKNQKTERWGHHYHPITTKNIQVMIQIMVVYEPFFMAFCLDLQDWTMLEHSCTTVRAHWYTLQQFLRHWGRFLFCAGIWRTRVLHMISKHWTAPKQLHSHGWVKVSWPFFFSFFQKSQKRLKIKKHSHQTHNWKQCLSKKNAGFNITPYFGRKYIQSKKKFWPALAAN